MDAAYRRRTAGRGRRTAYQTRRPAQKDGAEGDRRRLIRLLVSLVLFLLVYVGRGVFPGQLEFWQQAMAADVDFKAVFAEFSRAISEGEPVQSAFEALCASMLGGEGEQDGQDPIDPAKITQITAAPIDGLSYISGRGALSPVGAALRGEAPISGALIQNVDTLPPAATTKPDPEPEPSSSAPAQAVTAVAQDHTDDGVKLPSNVSFAYYDLGLEQTAVPVMGAATSNFGYRDHPSTGKNEFHLALDIGAAEGAEIGAFADGVVEYIGESDIFGLYLKINHDNNVSSFYAHCSKLLVQKGDIVTCGQTVALVGHTGDATGPHLHLTIEKDNIRLDPAYYVDLSATGN